MAELFDTSRMPDEPGQWDALAARVAAHAARASRPGGFDRFASSRAGWIAASLLLAAALAFLLLPAGDSARSFGPVWAQALAPADEIGKALTLPDAPPPIAALLLGAREGEVR